MFFLPNGSTFSEKLVDRNDFLPQGANLSEKTYGVKQFLCLGGRLSVERNQHVIFSCWSANRFSECFDQVKRLTPDFAVSTFLTMISQSQKTNKILILHSVCGLELKHLQSSAKEVSAYVLAIHQHNELGDIAN